MNRRLQTAGVDDWLAFSDPTLEVEAHNPAVARRSDTITRGPAFEGIRPLITFTNEPQDELPAAWPLLRSWQVV